MRVKDENETIYQVLPIEYCIKEIKGAEDWKVMVCHDNHYLFWLRAYTISMRNLNSFIDLWIWLRRVVLFSSRHCSYYLCGKSHFGLHKPNISFECLWKMFDLLNRKRSRLFHDSPCIYHEDSPYFRFRISLYNDSNVRKFQHQFSYYDILVAVCSNIRYLVFFEVSWT